MGHFNIENKGFLWDCLFFSAAPKVNYFSFTFSKLKEMCPTLKTSRGTVLALLRLFTGQKIPNNFTMWITPFQALSGLKR